MNTTTFSSPATPSKLPSSPTKMAKIPPKLFNTTTPKKINTPTNRDSTPHWSSLKTKPTTKVEYSTPNQSDTYGEKIEIPIVSFNKDEFSYLIEEISSFNQRSRDKLSMYGYADIPSIMEASKDDILRLELPLNDRRFIKALKLFFVNRNLTHSTTGDNWKGIRREEFHNLHVNSIYQPFSVASKL